VQLQFPLLEFRCWKLVPEALMSGGDSAVY
jgi:hypothetical protein